MLGCGACESSGAFHPGFWAPDAGMTAPASVADGRARGAWLQPVAALRRPCGWKSCLWLRPLVDQVVGF